jgi:hypothetical protein
MRNIVNRPIQLPEELGMYVDSLRKRYPSIEEVWLLGPRANAVESRGSEWDLLAFGDAATLAAIRADASVHRDDLNFMIVTDGDSFERAWGPPERRRLSAIEWRLEDLHSASYRASNASRAFALRVR